MFDFQQLISKLEYLHENEASGTLVLAEGDKTAKIVFVLGAIESFTIDDLTGEEAIMQFPGFKDANWSLIGFPESQVSDSIMPPTKTILSFYRSIVKNPAVIESVEQMTDTR